eukprot:GILK01006429.1.p1 GENE.GILK01006429.1~~GILK01006429.1.p1  ORF type:complete len:435 (-),score=57.85 GILK01006429.1:83-1318(-)
MAERGLGVRGDPNKEGWERSEFPVLCETCLGDNPYVRMTKHDFDKECKICTRPFTVFRWRPGSKARFKKTEICQVCARLKNVCQTCILDLEYGLPVQVRDKYLAEHDRVALPESNVNREYAIMNAQQGGAAQLPYNREGGPPNEALLKLARDQPYYKRNRAHICSFFVKGECKRGDQCPFRHEMPETGELANQNIKDRFHGSNDPVAKKLLGKVDNMNKLVPPDDRSITTLYVGGLDPRVTEEDLRDQFYAHGEIRSIRMVPHQACAFVSYTTREAAEQAAELMAERTIVKGLKLRIMWGKPPAPPGSQQTPAYNYPALPIPVPSEPTAAAGEVEPTAPGAAPAQAPFAPPPPGAAPPLPPAPFYPQFAPPPPAGTGGRPYYPSMDPSRMGAVNKPRPNYAPPPPPPRPAK